MQPTLPCAPLPQLSREEIKIGLETKLGSTPSEVLVDNVIMALDSDHTGIISRSNFEQMDAAPLKVKLTDAR
jgi:hypothetical protein